MRGFIKVVSGGLTIFKEWRIVESLKRYMEMIIWKLIQWVNQKSWIDSERDAWSKENGS